MGSYASDASRAEDTLAMKYIHHSNNTYSSILKPRILKATFLTVVLSGLLLVPSIWVSSAIERVPAKQPMPLSKNKFKPVVSQAVGFAESVAARDLETKSPSGSQDLQGSGEGLELNDLNGERVKHPVGLTAPTHLMDGALQSGDVAPNIPAASLTFDGLSNNDNLTLFGGTVLPSDATIDVGPNHIVQTVNLAFRVYNKSGTPLTAVAKLSSLFAPLGSPCGSRNDGDPVVLYDPLADRWLISQFCLSFNPNMHQLIAISKTGDPTGAYFLYNFVMPNNDFDDYPHYGVWPDAYYLTTNEFNQSGTSFLGGGAFAFDRKKMLQGDPSASYVYFDEGLIDPSLGGELPTDIDGVVTPPVGTPNLFMEFRAVAFGDPADSLRMFEFHPDFSNPSNSTFTQRPDVLLVPFDASQPASANAIEQPPPAGSSSFLDSLADRLMHRIAYRTLAGGVQSYVLNFTVNVSGTDGSSASTYQAGIRWVELRRNSTTGAVTVNQQGTYAPGAGDGMNGRNTWMASVAQDYLGDIGLGFSVSSLTQFPSILYAGRLVGDAAGTLGQGENTLFAGTGSQQHTAGRWGDYAATSVDPSDECTFWHTNQYYSASGTSPWRTRIGAFKVDPNCTAQPKGTITGRITDCQTGNPVSNAVITTPEGFFRQTDANGNYSIIVSPGTYSVSVSKSGVATTCGGSVTVGASASVTLNCCLQVTSCTISCPANVVKVNDPNQCGAVVSYATATTIGTCGTVTCLPASGSFFSKGTTTVTCTAGSAPSCSFIVTVQDTQPPAFSTSCPATINAAAAYQCPYATGGVINFTAPTASDNCPGVAVACNPPSGSTFPVGSTIVTCTATDTSNNTSSCSFTLNVYSACLVDDTNAGNVVFFNAATGDYRFCCNGIVVATGRAAPAVVGCNVTIDFGKGNRHVHIAVTGTVSGSGTASITKGANTICQINDSNLTGNACICP
jgi:hypothetical protein